MASYRIWPLIDEIVEAYFGENGWTPVERWRSEYLVALELFANSELQRRAEAQVAASRRAIRVRGSRSIN